MVNALAAVTDDPISSFTAEEESVDTDARTALELAAFDEVTVEDADNLTDGVPDREAAILEIGVVATKTGTIATVDEAGVALVPDTACIFDEEAAV